MRFYAVLERTARGSQLELWTCAPPGGALGPVDAVFSINRFGDPVGHELSSVVTLPDGRVTRAILVADGTANAHRTGADATVRPLAIARNLLLVTDDGQGTIEWQRRDGSTGSRGAVPVPSPAATAT